MKTIIITPGPEAWSTFRKACEAKGWKYQTLANKKKVPQVGKPVEIENQLIHRVEVK